MKFKARFLILAGSLLGFFLLLIFALIIQLLKNEIGIEQPFYITLPITAIAFFQLIGVSYVIY
jgi:hypothetical protein